MQARLNQGLYAEGPGSSIEWDGDTTGKAVFHAEGEFYRVADYVYIEDGASLVATAEIDGEIFIDELVAVDRSEEVGAAKGTIIELIIKEYTIVEVFCFNNFSPAEEVTLDGVYFKEDVRKLEIPGEVYNKIPSKFIDLDTNQIYKVIIAYNEDAYKLHEMKDSSGNIIGTDDVINAMNSGKTVIAEYNSGNKHYLTQNVFRQRNNFIVFLFVIDYDYNRDAVYLAGYPGSRDGEAQVYDKNATPSSTSYYASVTNMKDKLINFLIAEFACNEAVHVDSFMLPTFNYEDLTQGRDI